jgi:4-diphosphocytidyl-2-C-methyl-D-erythritol kinase
MEMKSYAKINLMLAVLARRPDGYHELVSAMCLLDLCDRVQLFFEGSEIQVACSHPMVPESSGNLAYRAATAFFDAFGRKGSAPVRGIRILIEKRIPVAAGLGGGSSNAACVLRALNQYYDSPFSKRELMAIGLSLGADVPFFLFGKTALATGIGERLQVLSNVPSYPVLLVNPNVCVSTGQVFKNLDFRLTKCKKKIRHNLLNGQDFEIPGDLCNDLESVTERAYPDIRSAKQALLKYGAMGALMSGSGPTVFGLFSDEDTLSTAGRKLSKSAGWSVFQTRILV